MPFAALQTITDESLVLLLCPAAVNAAFCGKRSMKFHASFFMFELLFHICEILDGTNQSGWCRSSRYHTRNNLYQRIAIAHIGDHGLRCVKQRTIGDADDIGRNDLILVVTKRNRWLLPS